MPRKTSSNHQVIYGVYTIIIIIVGFFAYNYFWGPLPDNGNGPPDNGNGPPPPPPPTSWEKYSNPIFTSSHVTWTSSSPNNPAILRSPKDGSAIKYDGYFWMVYNTHGRSGGNPAIGLARSTNLASWSDVSWNPILDESDPSAEDWESGDAGDAYTLYSNDFLYMGDEAFVSYNFWVFYTGHHRLTHYGAIGIAKSNDMHTWVRDTAHNPIASWMPTFVGNYMGIEDWRLQKMSRGGWVAVYEADVTQVRYGDKAVGIAHTSSSLPNSGWSDQGQVFSSITDGGQYIANPTLIRYDKNGVTYYEMLYEWLKFSPGRFHAYGAYTTEAHLFELDGWSRSQYNPIIPQSEGWEGEGCVPNGFVLHNGALHCYYTGSSSTSTRIGLSVGPHLVDMETSL